MLQLKRFLCVILLAAVLAGCQAAPGETGDPIDTVSPIDAVGPVNAVTPVDTINIEENPALIGLPGAGQLYHGVYPGGVTGEEDDLTLQDLRSYEAAVGKPAARDASD